MGIRLCGAIDGETKAAGLRLIKIEPREGVLVFSIPQSLSICFIINIRRDRVAKPHISCSFKSLMCRNS